MKPMLKYKGFVCRYRQVDIRDLDGAALLASHSIADNILAVLARLDDSTKAIRQILHKIEKLEKPMREPALQKLLVTCAVRDLIGVVEREMETVPITIDLAETDSYVRRIVEKGRQEGGKNLARPQLEKRFGRLSASANERINAMNEAEMADLAVRILDAKSISELFG